MQCKRVFLLLANILVLAFASPALAENGAFTGSGGTFSPGTAVGQSISVTGVPLAGTSVTLSLSCPITFFGGAKWTCAGGSVTAASTDNSFSAKGSFVAGAMTLSGSGGGRGGHVTYWYQFKGTFTSQVKRNGPSQGALGSVSIAVKSGSPIGKGTAPVTGLSLGWNSQYSPVLLANYGNSPLLLADNVTGVNLASYGTWGNGTGQFESIAGLAHDSAGRIYITDSSLDRLVRIDNVKGMNWLQLGNSGVGNLHFSSPEGVAIDSSGRIWVADTGNNRIVRFTDMTGANWTSFGTSGSGASQFSSPAAIAFDAQGRIYVADYGNGRLVRFDDLTGKNWTTLSTISIDPYAYSFTAANGVVVLPSGKIVVSTYGGWTFRVDDMTAANPEVGYWSASLGGIASDPGGALYVVGSFNPGLAQILDAVGTGRFGGTMGQATLQARAVLSMATSVVPPAAPVISKTAMAFGKQNVGEPSAGQAVVLSNIGGGTLPVSSIAADLDFKLGNPCGASLAGGASCAVAVQFDPTSTGAKSASLSFSTAGVHPCLKPLSPASEPLPTASFCPPPSPSIRRRPPPPAGRRQPSSPTPDPARSPSRPSLPPAISPSPATAPPSFAPAMAALFR